MGLYSYFAGNPKIHAKFQKVVVVLPTYPNNAKASYHSDNTIFCSEYIHYRMYPLQNIPSQFQNNISLLYKVKKRFVTLIIELHF
jgi:hypothetical protein